MTGSQVVEATDLRRPAVTGSPLPLLLCVLAGFSSLLVEQGLEKYLQLLVGTTASASAAVLCAWFLGFALGGIAAAGVIRKGRIGRPLLAYGLVELLIGISCIAFSYSFHGVIPFLAPLQNLFAAPFLRFQARFLCACLLVLPTSALMGASLPLIAEAFGTKRWAQAYAMSLMGAFAASLAAPFLIMPAFGLRGALWICFAIGAIVCAVSATLPDDSGPAPSSDGSLLPHFPREIRLLLAASFGAGAILFALGVIWTHLIAVVVGSSVYGFSWLLAAVLLGILLGAAFVNRRAQSGRGISLSRLFQCAALALVAQFCLWDRVPGIFTLVPPAFLQDFFYFAEIFKLLVVVALIAPPAAILGVLYPRLLASPQFQGEPNASLCAYLSAAHSLGCLVGALAGIFVLAPVAGSEVALKTLVLALAVLWIVFLLRESLSVKRLVTAGLIVAALVVVVLGRWWNWGLLTAGRGNSYGQSIAQASVKASSDARYVPPSFVFKHEDAQGGFTTVVEQTVIAGEAARTVRTLYRNGVSQADDNPDAGEAWARFGYSAVPSLFVPDYGRALLIGLGTGYEATALKRLGYHDIDVAEFAPGIVRAAVTHFSGFNEGVLGDRSVALYLEDGRNLLLRSQGRKYDLITVEVPGFWFAGVTNFYSREFYELARSRLKNEGVLQQWAPLHRNGPREIASQLATAHSVFPYVGLWYYGGQGLLVAANRPLTNPHLQSTAVLSPQDAEKLTADLLAAKLLDNGGVTWFVNETRPFLNTDHNRWMEYSVPRYQSSGYDWLTYNLGVLRQYK